MGVNEQNTLFSEPWHIHPKQTTEAIVDCAGTLYLSKREIIHSNGSIQLIVSIFKIPRVCIYLKR